MEQCNIYTHELDLNTVTNIIAAILPKAVIDIEQNGINILITANIKGGFFSKNKALKINYRCRTNPSYTLDNVNCAVSKNLEGMANFVSSFTTSNEDVKNQLIYKIKSINAEMAFIADPSISEFKDVLSAILEQMNGIVFAQPNAFFNRSRTTHFTDKNFNVIIDQEGRCEIDNLDVQTNSKYLDHKPYEVTESQKNRMANSAKFLNQNNIKLNKNLPPIEDDDYVTLRSLEEVVDRVYALMIVAVKGEGLGKAELDHAVKTKNISGFTPKELYLVDQENLDGQDKVIATWRYESLNTLVWALGLIPDLVYPSEICNVSEIVGKLFETDPNTLKINGKLLDKKIILDELDKTYRINWACVDARINNIEVGGNINSSVIYERHYSLNWLTQYMDQDWDDVQTNT